MRTGSIRRLILLPVLSVILTTVYLFGSNQNAKELKNEEILDQRHLLMTYNDDYDNCTPAAIEQFPRPLLTKEQRRSGGIAIHILVSLYMFTALAVVCDEYFVPSLESITDSLNLQPDVAGATFMAAGSSAPELATSVLAVFVTKDDIGLGAVVGSAVFNIMLVIGVCALFAGNALQLNWWPVTRDCFAYFISIGVMLIALYDEIIVWYEAAIFLCLYIMYCCFMYFNRQAEAWIKSKTCPSRCCSNNLATESSQLIENVKTSRSTDDMFAAGKCNGNEEISEDLSSVSDIEDEDSIASPFKVPARRRCIWVLLLPITFACYVTIPDCRKKRWKKWFLCTFIMSVLWISVYSYFMVWMITIIGYTFGIPDTVMGLTFLAAGVSVPDALSSLMVVKAGQGDMAVSNAIGSNVFDILLCLGLPWFLKTSVISPGSTVQVFSRGLTYSTVTLFCTVGFLLLSLHCTRWQLNKTLGVLLLILYVGFLAIASLYELNVFGYYNPPECPSDY